MEISRREEEALIAYFKQMGIVRISEFDSASISDFKTIKVANYRMDTNRMHLRVKFHGESNNGDWDEEAKIKIPLVDFILFNSHYNKG